MHIFALFGRNPFAMRPRETTAKYVKSNKAAEMTDAIGNVENVGIIRIGSDRIYVFFTTWVSLGSDRIGRRRF